VLAAISAQHCISPDFASTDWPGILFLYDSLLEIDPSPIVRLNRTVALARVKGPLAALDELEKIKQHDALQTYYLFHATEGEFYMEMHRFEEAARCIQSAIDLAPLKAERHLLEKKLEACRRQMR